MTTLTDTQVVTASGGLVELGHQSTDRTNLAVSGTSTSNAVELVTTTVVCDGSPVTVEFQCGMSVTSGEYLSFGVWIDGTYTTTFEGSMAVAGRAPISAWARLTPSAGSRIISIRWWKWSGGTSTSYIEGNCRVRVSKIVQATQWPAVTTGTIICTSSTRPASPFEGQTIYETDTDLELRWTGSAWVVSGSNGGSFLSASSTTTVPAASAITYTQASITLTPGVWEVQAAMTLINGTTTDSAAVAIYNQTTSAVVSGSYGTPGYTSTTWAAALQSMPTKMTVTSNTQVCPYGNRNGGSTVATAGGVGAPVGLITARRLYGG